MKITADMVGKRVLHKSGVCAGRVAAVGGDEFWLEYKAGSHTTELADGNWELAPEPPKKPSARILDIEAGASLSFCDPAHRRYFSICAYLDELREQGKI